VAEMVLPGTYIEVRPEGLITPGRVSVGTIGMVGTAAKGPVDTPVFLGSYLEAREVFGEYDAWQGGTASELTLVRALEIAYAHGASVVLAVRVAAGSAKAASFLLSSPDGDLKLSARTPGTWGNSLKAQVVAAQDLAFITDEGHNGPSAVKVDHIPVARSARNRIVATTNGMQRSLNIFYADDTNPAPPAATALGADDVIVDRTTGALTLPTALGSNDAVVASYAVEISGATTVVLTNGRDEERFTVVSGEQLIGALKGSAWVTGARADVSKAVTKLALTAGPATFGSGPTNDRGSNGEAAGNTEYKAGLTPLENEAAHIIVGAGRDDSFGDELKAHCDLASSDVLRRDRIAVVGSGLGATLDKLRGHNLNSDRLVYVTPGITFGDAAGKTDVTLPGAYAAAAVAGMLSSYPAHVSLTNKVLSVGDLEVRFTPTQLSQLVQARILALEVREGCRVVRAVTTSTISAWTVITTRRIVDYAKFGVRSACNPYIGLLNNERVRTNLQSTIASFLNEMLADEMLTDYKLQVTATRDDEIKGLVEVTLLLQPVFSIEFIKVTMLLH
jgi:hypothetical protein